MWRPFACSFASHAYENFIKKYDRAESAPLRMQRENAVNEKVKKNKSVEGICEEAEKRIQDFKTLKLRVIQQRKMIKTTDLNIRKHYEVQLKAMRDRQRKDKEAKKNEIIRIRGLSKAKPPRPISKIEEKTPTSNFFGLTAPSENYRRSITKTPLENYGRSTTKTPLDSYDRSITKTPLENYGNAKTPLPSIKKRNTVSPKIQSSRFQEATSKYSDGKMVKIGQIPNKISHSPKLRTK